MYCTNILNRWRRRPFYECYGGGSSTAARDHDPNAPLLRAFDFALFGATRLLIIGQRIRGSVYLLIVRYNLHDQIYVRILYIKLFYWQLVHA